jgi:hypothetical protein
LPFADVDYLVSQIAKFNMAVIFTEIVNTFFGENSLDEIVTIAYQNGGNDLDYEKSHRLLQCWWNKLLVGRILTKVLQLAFHVAVLV